MSSVRKTIHYYPQSINIFQILHPQSYPHASFLSTVLCPYQSHERWRLILGKHCEEVDDHLQMRGVISPINFGYQT